jgi:hypothetical protein
MTIEAREALEDKVYELHSELDMSDIQQMTNKELTELVNLKMALRNDQLKPSKAIGHAKQSKPVKPKWQKISASHEVRNGELVLVEKWNIENVFGTTLKDRVTVCGTRTMYDGRLIASSILKHYLLNGEWIKRIPKPAKHRAIVRNGKKVTHLGYFVTLEEKNDAIFAQKHRNNLNVSPNG